MKLSLKGLLGALNIGGAVVLVGCNGSGLSSAERIISSGWAGVSNEDSEDQPSLYCYKTLAEPDCYTTPDPNRSAQFVSVYPAKNPARSIGVKKVVDILMEDDDDAEGVQERELDKVRYYPSSEEKALSKNLEAVRRGKEVAGPLKLE